MPVVLARIDDRLIHGQVTVGWSEKLQPDRIILADNAIAADPWQSRVYASSVPPAIAVSIDSVAKAAAKLRAESVRGEKIILLTAAPSEMADLARIGVPLRRVNIGGMHFGPGKVEMLPFVYVDRQDLGAMRRLLDSGVELYAQQVPGGREHGVSIFQVEAMERQLR